MACVQWGPIALLTMYIIKNETETQRVCMLPSVHTTILHQLTDGHYWLVDVEHMPDLSDRAEISNFVQVSLSKTRFGKMKTLSGHSSEECFQCFLVQSICHFKKNNHILDPNLSLK